MHAACPAFDLTSPLWRQRLSGPFFGAFEFARDRHKATSFSRKPLFRQRKSRPELLLQPVRIPVNKGCCRVLISSMYPMRAFRTPASDSPIYLERSSGPFTDKNLAELAGIRPNLCSTPKPQKALGFGSSCLPVREKQCQACSSGRKELFRMSYPASLELSNCKSL